MGSQTIEEIKSRRVAITRHQRDIQASLDTVRGLAEEAEQIHSTSDYDRGRATALIDAKFDPTPWENIHWEFYELKQSIDALGERATKIQEGVIGLVSVYGGGEQSDPVSKIGLFISFVLASFPIIQSIYCAKITDESGNYSPGNRWGILWKGIFGTGFATFACYLFLSFRYTEIR